jgi:hypothetical protein
MRTNCIFVFVCLFLCVSCQLSAQSDSSSISKNKVVYFNNFLAGGIFGKTENGSGPSFLMTHGVRMNRLALGAGVGFDSYLDWKTMPIIGSVYFDFAKIKRNAFFILFNAGYSNAWRIKEEDPIFDERVRGGEVINSMVGYRIKTNQFSLYISAGHKVQKVQRSYNPTPWSSIPRSKISIEENMNRMVVQIGFGLH